MLTNQEYADIIKKNKELIFEMLNERSNLTSSERTEKLKKMVDGDKFLAVIYYHIAREKRGTHNSYYNGLKVYGYDTKKYVDFQETIELLNKFHNIDILEVARLLPASIQTKILSVDNKELLFKERKAAKPGFNPNTMMLNPLGFLAAKKQLGNKKISAVDAETLIKRTEGIPKDQRTQVIDFIIDNSNNTIALAKIFNNNLSKFNPESEIEKYSKISIYELKSIATKMGIFKPYEVSDTYSDDTPFIFGIDFAGKQSNDREVTRIMFVITILSVLDRSDYESKEISYLEDYIQKLTNWLMKIDESKRRDIARNNIATANSMLKLAAILSK
ncbi:MAG: hypothetical protein U9N34_10255 [Candidatus Cloacimonadota bacterium]|nr:hypothetical protein [Candidatus Cloacimonadota bacterium]